MKEKHGTNSAYHAWNPGLASSVPAALEPMITLFRLGNSTVDYQRAQELSDFCGLSADQLIVFSVERLIVHELLVRVTSDLSVPDGPNYEDLGINLRSMVNEIYQSLKPEIGNIQATYDTEVARARSAIETQLSEHVFGVPGSEQQKSASLIQRLFTKKPKEKKSPSLSEPKEFKALACWNSELEKENDSTTRHCLLALVKTISAIVSRRGQVINEPELLATIATNYASNRIGDDLVSEKIGEVFETIIAKHRYRLLPIQKKPVVMNVKGASASGKSTIRPQQRQLANKLGIPWEDFALISPDYWRKYLLDYDSLGNNYKYAAMLTGQELVLIDRKLDRYMAQKAKRGAVPHLLIDRFRFDSFSVEDGRSQDSKLLSRFGDQIYLFFMITPPAETVVRAWERGNTTGRFKAVDDLLYHNIEAFTGMPELFFSWVLSEDKRIHFEFLDNDVPKGELPKTVAFGRNKSMTVLDINAMCNIDRYREVNIDATGPEEVLFDNADIDFKFLSRCVREIDAVRIADAETGRVDAKFSNGTLLWKNSQAPDGQGLGKKLQEHFSAVTTKADSGKETVMAEDKNFTLGHWGTGLPD